MTNGFVDDGLKKTRFFTSQALKKYCLYPDKLKMKFDILDNNNNNNNSDKDK